MLLVVFQVYPYECTHFKDVANRHIYFESPRARRAAPYGDTRAAAAPRRQGRAAVEIWVSSTEY